MPWGSSPSLQTSTPVEETGHMFPEIESSLSYIALEISDTSARFPIWSAMKLFLVL